MPVISPGRIPKNYYVISPRPLSDSSLDKTNEFVTGDYIRVFNNETGESRLVFVGENVNLLDDFVFQDGADVIV